ncbi:MAG: cell division protein FtsA [Kiritimatiellae bacterium]|nr:cell division protein FtsA [Kiritimatiellia bacterium]
MGFRDQPIVVALELGTTKTRALVGELREDNHLMLLGLGEAPSQGIRKSEIIDFDAALAGAEYAIAQAEENAKVGIKQVNLLVSGGNLRTIMNSASIPLEDGGEITREDVSHVLEVARTVNLPEDYELVHSIPQSFTINDQTEVLNPTGLEGDKIGVKMLILYASSVWLRNLVKVAKSASVDVEIIAASGLCAALAVLAPEEKQQGAVVIDLGGGSTNYIAYARQTIAAAGSFAVGGDHLTNDLARGLKITLSQAERLKEQCGSAVIDLRRRGEHIELTPESSGRGRYVRLGDLQTITHHRMEETLSLVRDELERKELLHHLGRGVVLTGGGAYLRGVTELAERVFNLPCQLGQPKDVSGVALATDGPQYASAIGLLRMAAQQNSRRKPKILSFLGSFLGNR